MHRMAAYGRGDERPRCVSRAVMVHGGWCCGGLAVLAIERTELRGGEFGERLTLSRAVRVERWTLSEHRVSAVAVTATA